MNNLESPKQNQEITRKAEILDIPILINLISENLGENLSEENKTNEGFLTFNPNKEELAEIIKDTGIILSLKGSELKGYFMTMSKNLARKNSFFSEMIANAEGMVYENKKISEYNYVVLAQICVAKPFRGGGTFAKLHSAAHSMLKEKNFEIGFAEIDDANKKSLAVNSFLTDIGTYESSKGIVWHIFVLDLKKD